MRFSENRKLALAVLVVCVIVSIFGLGGIGLARERGKVLAVYDRGADTSLATRYSVDAYLDSAAQNAGLMASEAGLHMDASPLIDEVAQLGQKVASEENTFARNEAFTALKTAVDQLYDAMYKAAKGDDFKNFKVAYDNFWENANMIKYDEYPKLAASYNSLISGIPGSLVAAITGQGALATFGG